MNIDSLTPQITAGLHKLARTCQRDLNLLQAARSRVTHTPEAQRIETLISLRRETLSWTLPLLQDSSASTIQVRSVGFLPTKHLNKMTGIALTATRPLAKLSLTYAEFRFSRHLKQLLNKQNVSPRTRPHLLNDCQKRLNPSLYGCTA